MNRVRLLPEQVANQIAAGEVVERPASVVKELVENALDAQARHLIVEVQAGGRSLVRVIDDGWGMSRDDALLCLERHATSKIKRAEDLADIATLGFRGEALPSIASVSRFSLTTRERDNPSPEATQVIISGGKMLEVKSAGSATGTTVEVRQLFFNLPARRKFLRSEETESAHILHYLTLAALAFPEVAFTFQKDGRTVWQLPPASHDGGPASRLTALKERLRGLYGEELNLLPVDFTADLTDSGAPDDQPSASADVGPAARRFRLWGYMGRPGVSRATREDQHLFVNRRPVESRGLNFALLEGYHTALMKGRYPVCCLFVEVPASAVDVNIHPAKREVRFHREAEVRRLVAQAVRQTLLEYHNQQSKGQSPKSKGQSPQSTVHGPESRIESQTAAVQGAESEVPGAGGAMALPNFPEELVSNRQEAQPQPPSQAPLRLGFSPTQPRQIPGLTAVKPAAGELVGPAATDAAHARVVANNPPEVVPPAGPREPIPLLNVPLRLVGVIGKLYVVLESDRGLVLLDQHAAHERVLFEQMLTRLEQQEQAPSQRLLLPETVELSSRDAFFLRDQLGVLTRLGVGLSEFGERTFLLDALPPFVKAASPRQFVLELVDELKAAGQEVNSLRLGEHTVAKTVCRHAIKANDPLAEPELENLVRDLRHCAMPYTCPHGRPTLIEMNFRELEKKFGRTQ
jgi:DNA mismatch repair protein MutL